MSLTISFCLEEPTSLRLGVTEDTSEYFGLTKAEKTATSVELQVGDAGFGY